VELLLNAYQEGLVSLEQLRCRMPELRKQQQAAQAELQVLEAAVLCDLVQGKRRSASLDSPRVESLGPEERL
jgi:hypothetical protein